MSDIRLSSIILNYRSWGLISNCIDSITKYPLKDNYEIIVIDNDSQDGKFDKFSKKYNHVKCVKNLRNFSYSSGCNLGATYAIGKYLLFLNPDIEFTKSLAVDAMIEYAETVAKQAKTHPILNQVNFC